MSQLPHPGRRLASRVLAAGVVVVALAAGVVSFVLDHTARDIAKDLTPIDQATRRQLDRPAPGAAQTILLAGLDHRYADGPKAGSRSDTMMLVRLDPKAKATAILSLPRDLRVTSLGPHGQQKLNSAWFTGGSERLTHTIKTAVLGTPQDPFRINGIVSVKFDAFAKVINHLGCLYAEVDRHYFIPPNSGHAEIDQPAGYQLLCGQSALSYVRFRVQDSDFVREARQANYLTEVRSQVRPEDVLSGTLLKDVGDYVRTNITSARQLLAIAKLLVYVAGKPTARITLGGLSDADDGTNDVLTTPAALAEARRRFFHPRVAPAATKGSASASGASGASGAKDGSGQGVGTKRSTGTPKAGTPKSAGRSSRRRAKASTALPATMTTDAAGADAVPGQVAPGLADAGVGTVDVLAPTSRYGRGAYEPEMTRGYAILGKDRQPRWPSYRIVASTGDTGQYYGVEGTTWRDPPILQLASDEVRLGGRDWKVQYDGREIRRLIWPGPNGTYWVTNTLTNELSLKEMYAVARSMRPVGRR
ncbi:LCP family protein [Patulibacter sp. NPDC049589]|uniref:LCP family protein n=1 Tax=Patulibacter sp. NPDC049589 TaxID=3154731 RepID=UPI00342CF9F2